MNLSAKEKPRGTWHKKIPNGILGIGLLVCVFGFIYAIYRGYAYPQGVMIKYYIVFTCGALLLGIAFTFSDGTKTNFVLVVVAFGVSVYLTEILIFFFNPVSRNLTHHAKAGIQMGVPFDVRSPFQVITDLTNQGQDAYPAVHPRLFVKSNGMNVNNEKIFPLGSLSEKTTVFCNESGEFTIVETDEHGFNNPTGIYEKDTLDMALVGDSFAAGACVKQGQDIAGQLRNRGRTVLTVASMSNGPLMELAALKEYLLPLRPKTVLWMYYEGNDLQDLMKEEKSTFLMKYLDDEFSQDLLERQTEIDEILQAFVATRKEQEKEKLKQKWINDYSVFRILRLYELRQLLRLSDSYPSRLKLPPFRNVAPLLDAVLREAKKMVASWGGNLFFVYLPSWDRYNGTVNQSELYYRDRVLALVRKIGVALIDFHIVLNKHPDPLSFFPFRLPGHYTAKGYALAAHTIETYLSNNGVPLPDTNGSSRL